MPTIVSRAKLAEIWGLAPSAIDKLYTRQLCVKVGIDKYDLEGSDRLYIPHLRSMAAGRHEKSPAREKLLNAQTKLVDIKRQIAEGEFVSFQKTHRPLLEKIFSAHQSLMFELPEQIWHAFHFDKDTMTKIEAIIDAARFKAADLIKETPIEFRVDGKVITAPAAPPSCMEPEPSS